MSNRHYTLAELNKMTRIQLSYESTDAEVLEGIKVGFLIFDAQSQQLLEKIHVSLPPAIDVFIIRLTYLDQDLKNENEEREILVRISKLLNHFLTDKSNKRSLKYFDEPIVLPDVNDYEFTLDHLNNGI